MTNTISDKAVDMLAAECERSGREVTADRIRRGYSSGRYILTVDEALRAITAALQGQEHALKQACEPWSNYHGDLPDYDHPLRCVYESGIQYAVNLLAKYLDVDDYEICDGTEEFDGDLGGTLLNIVLAAMPKNADGDPIYPQELRAALQEQEVRETSAEYARGADGLEQVANALREVHALGRDGIDDAAFDANMLGQIAACERGASLLRLAALAHPAPEGEGE